MTQQKLNYPQQMIDICQKIMNEASKYNLMRHELAKTHRSEIYEVTSQFPESAKFGHRIQFVATNDPALCKWCGKTHGKMGKLFCNETCYFAFASDRRENAIPYHVTFENKKWEDYSVGKEENVDFVVCKICGIKRGDLSGHLDSAHNLKPKEYRNLYNSESLALAIRLKTSGENNPAYQHGGRLSPFSSKFIYADTIDLEAVHKKKEETYLRNKNNSVFFEYWLRKTNGDVEEAKRLYKKRQVTFSLEICIEKLGAEAGLERWLQRQDKWNKSYVKSTYSKISQELFHSIIGELPEIKDICFFAENNGEIAITMPHTVTKPDFLYENKVIEFDGTYWHAKEGAAEADRLKDLAYAALGYEVLRIPEKDYYLDKKGVVQKCIDFLKQ